MVSFMHHMTFWIEFIEWTIVFYMIITFELLYLFYTWEFPSRDVEKLS